MKTPRLSDAIGNIPEDLISEAVTYKRVSKKKSFIRWGAIAACLTLVVMGGIIGHLLRSPDTPDVPKDNIVDSIMSYFTITAYAANGESTDLLLPDGFLSSVPGQQDNVFGVDMPLFHFDVKPSDLKSNEAVYERFDISISYNGTTVSVTDKDEHIFVAYIYSIQSSQSLGYSIFGWFTEPTDIIIHVLDKESREIVEAITVSVNYLADKQEYELKVTNLTTKFAEQKETVDAHNYFLSYLLAGSGTNYPEWFGGCYIKENKLHIKLVSPYEEELKRLTYWFASYNDVIVYEEAESSMADLQAYADQAAKELMDHGYAVTMWYVDSITGNIEISVLAKDFEAVSAWVNAASQNGNAPKIVIEIGEYVELDDSRVIEFCADPFLQSNSLSWMYSMNVKIDMDNEKIYLNDIPYGVSYVDNVEPDFSFLAPGPYVNEKITEVLDQISSQKGRYLLETQGESKFGQTLAMYVIGDTYYFIRFFDNGSVMRIHAGTIQ